ALTADAVRDQLKSYQTERAAADTSGLAKKFSPEWYQKADNFAKRGEEALDGGRLVEALDNIRQARWHLPGLPATLKEHVARIFGDVRLRHTGEVYAVAFSPDGQRLATACG